MASNCCSLLAEIDLLLKTLKAPALSLSKITLPSIKQKIKTLVMLDFCSSIFYRLVKPYFICLKGNSLEIKLVELLKLWI